MNPYTPLKSSDNVPSFMKTLLSILVIFCTVFAEASECNPLAPKHVAKSAEIAFIGSVEGVEQSSYKPNAYCWPYTGRSSRCGGKLVTLKVKQAIRGNVGKLTTVISEDACNCLGPYWKAGSTYLIVAKTNATGLLGQFVASNVCGGTGELDSRAEQIIKEFGVSEQ